MKNQNLKRYGEIQTRNIKPNGKRNHKIFTDVNTLTDLIKVLYWH